MQLVMIVDDSEADQFLAKHVLEEFDPNLEVLQAYDGLEALEMLKRLETQPDVIFLDINMPRMNGHEFLKAYSAWEEQSVVIVMLTSSDQEADREKSRAHKAVVDYFTKPLDVDSLAAVHTLIKPRA